ncbi:MAG: HNH endonuclease [Candidatus Eisenbacteria bacterium]
MRARLDDRRVRLGAFGWLEKQVAAHGDVLPRTLLQEGFEIDGERVPLISQQGIFKPRVLAEIPISITTTVHGPYNDRMEPEGIILYRYRGTDPEHPDNAGLHRAMFLRTPLIYFYAIAPGRYMPVWPVFIEGDDPAALMFRVAVDDRAFLDVYARAESNGLAGGEPKDEGRRQYVTAVVQRRLHQRGFRERVLDAYHQQCTLCRLKHAELLDAAHIIPDGEPGGDPVVENGLALCKLHHAAFDGFFLGVRPDFVIEVHPAILAEEDGPMLIHGLQGLHGREILLPRSTRNRPSADRLEIRYSRFLERRGQAPVL